MIFISHSRKDKDTADKVVQFLEKDGFKCWITPRDIPLGNDWADAIMSAIEESDTMILILSSSSNVSPHVRREVENAVSLCKKIIPVLIEDVKLSKWMKYCISIHQWHDACTGTLDMALPALYHALSGTNSAEDSKLLYTADQIEEELRSFTEETVEGIQLEPSELKPLIVISIKLPGVNHVLVRRIFPLLSKLAGMYSCILLPGDNDDRLRCFFGLTESLDGSGDHAINFARRAFHLVEKMAESSNTPNEYDPYGIGIAAGICELSWLGEYPVVRGSVLKEADALSSHGRLYASLGCFGLCGSSEWIKDHEGYIVEKSVLPKVEQSEFSFVGRQSTLGLLSELLKKQRISSEMNRRGGALHIVQGILGEAGMGKTSLLNRFLQVTDGKIKKLVYSFVDINPGVPFDLTEFFLKEYDIQYSFQDKTDSTQESTTEKDSQKLFLFAQIRDSLIPHANAGLIFIIDDAQKLSATDLTLLDFLVENTDSQKPILFILLYRKIDKTGKRVEFSFSGSFASSAELELKPLSLKDSSSLICDTLSSLSGTASEVCSELMEVVFNKTGGNPFYLSEITKECFKNGQIELENGTWLLKKESGDLNTSLPLSLTINAAIDSLPLNWKRTLQVCSVIGESLPASLLKHIESVMPEEWFSIQALDYLTERLYLKREQTAFRDYYRFRHELLREAAFSGISPENRHSIHRVIASTYEKIFEDNENYHKITAEHWVETGDKKKIQEWGSKALRLCIRTFKYSEALVWITRLKKFKTGSELTQLVLTESDLLGFLGKHTDRIKLLEQQLKCDTEIHLLEFIPNIQLDLGITRLEKGEIEIAEKFLRKAYASVQEKPSDKLTAKIQLTLGSLLVDAGGFDEARELLDLSLKRYRDTDFEEGIAQVKRIQAELQFKQGLLEESIVLCQEALICAEKTFNKRLQLSCLSAIGRAYYQLGQLDEAASYWNKDIEIAIELGFRFNECVVIRNMGGIHYLKGELEEALAAFRKSYEIAKELDDKKNMGSGLRNMTFVLERMGRREESRPLLDEAYQIAQASGDVGAQADSLLALAMFLDNMDEKEEAKIMYNRCIEASKISANLVAQATSLANLAGVYEQNSELEKAISIALQALELFKTLNHNNSLLLMYINIGSLHVSIGKSEKAYFFFKTALDLAEEIDAADHKAFLLSSLASYYLDKNNYVEALEYSRKATEAAEELNKSPGSRAHARAVFAFSLIMNSKFHEAEQLLEIIKILSEENDLFTEAVSVTCLTGLIAFHKGEKTLARENLQNAIDLFQLHQPPKHSVVGFEELQNALL